jgi:predicted ATPase
MDRLKNKVAIITSAVHWFRGDPAAQARTAEEAIALSEAQSLPLWLGVAKVFRGAARAVAETDAMGVAEMSETLTLVAGTGVQAGAPALFVLLAQAQYAVGQLAEAMVTIETGLVIAAQTGQPFSDAELHRAKGELLLAAPAGGTAEAEALFRHALEIARAQGARSLELRAVTSLARLLRDQRRHAEARDVLAPVYGWFTEGFDTSDLREAKALLELLA